MIHCPVLLLWHLFKEQNEKTRDTEVREREDIEKKHLHNVLHHSRPPRLAAQDNRGPILLIQSRYFF